MDGRLREELLEATRRIVAASDERNLEAYRAGCAPEMTCFEPEAKGALIEGLAFHEFFVGKANRPGTTARSEIVGFRARALGGEASGGDGAASAAMVCYTRITQKHDADGSFRLTHVNETRVFERRAGGEGDAPGGWAQVHFHRSSF